jgi:hypothetical protein
MCARRPRLSGWKSGPLTIEELSGVGSTLYADRRPPVGLDGILRQRAWWGQGLLAAPLVKDAPGYLSEEPDLPGWMRVDELLRYTQAFYPRWDPQYAEQLREQSFLRRNRHRR